MRRYCILSIIFCFGIDLLAKPLTQEKLSPEDLAVCQIMIKIQKPSKFSPGECYNQAKKLLENEKTLRGSHDRYFELSKTKTEHSTCRAFLEVVVAKAQKNQLTEAILIFEDDKTQSLDQFYYTYKMCNEKYKAEVLESENGQNYRTPDPQSSGRQ